MIQEPFRAKPIDLKVRKSSQARLDRRSLQQWATFIPPKAIPTIESMLQTWFWSEPHSEAIITGVAMSIDPDGEQSMDITIEVVVYHEDHEYRGIQSFAVNV